MVVADPLYSATDPLIPRDLIILRYVHVFNDESVVSMPQEAAMLNQRRHSSAGANRSPEAQFKIEKIPGVVRHSAGLVLPQEFSTLQVRNA